VFEYLDEEGKWSTARIEFGPDGVKHILIRRGLLTFEEKIQKEEALENVYCGPSWQLKVEKVLDVFHSVKQAHENGETVTLYQVSGDSSESSVSCFNKMRGGIASKTRVKCKYVLYCFSPLILFLVL